MPITFPNNPAANDAYTFNGRTWTYNGNIWTKGGAGGGGPYQGNGGNGGSGIVIIRYLYP